MENFIPVYLVLFLLPAGILALAFLLSYLTREEGE
jgi:hypothetical protein